MTSYKVYWTKKYYASGIVKIVANSFQEAESIARVRMGDYIGSMQYDPEGDEVEAYKWLGKEA